MEILIVILALIILIGIIIFIKNISGSLVIKHDFNDPYLFLELTGSIEKLEKKKFIFLKITR